MGMKSRSINRSLMVLPLLEGFGFGGWSQPLRQEQGGGM